MITDYKQIKTVPQVQVVIDMDGFGAKILKQSTYLRYIYKEPVQFTGFKLFYKNDNKGESEIVHAAGVAEIYAQTKFTFNTSN